MTQPDAVFVNAAAKRTVPAGASPFRHIRAFLDWWLEELAELLPDTARTRLAADERRAGLVLDGDSLQITDLRRGQTRPVCRIDLAGMSDAEARDAIGRALDRAGLGGGSVVLGIPEHMVLRRRESLPAGTERRLGDILRLRLDSIAPLPAGSFHWGYRITEQAADGRLTVECVLAKAEPVDALAERLGKLGLEAISIIPENDLPGEPSLNLIPAHLRREPLPLWSPLNQGLAALAAGLVVVALVMTFHRQDTTLAALNAELADLRGRAKAVIALRTEAQGQLRAVHTAREVKTSAPPVMAILDEISRLLPDGTWVNDFRLRGGEVTLTGQSESASSLIGLIDRSALFGNVHFDSPVVRDPKTGGERFNISFDWAGSDRPAARNAATREGGKP